MIFFLVEGSRSLSLPPSLSLFEETDHCAWEFLMRRFSTSAVQCSHLGHTAWWLGHIPDQLVSCVPLRADPGVSKIPQWLQCTAMAEEHRASSDSLSSLIPVCKDSQNDVLCEQTHIPLVTQIRLYAFIVGTFFFFNFALYVFMRRRWASFC